MTDIGYGEGISEEEDWPIGIDEDKFNTVPEEPIESDDCDGCKI